MNKIFKKTKHMSFKERENKLVIGEINRNRKSRQHYLKIFSHLNNQGKKKDLNKSCLAFLSRVVSKNEIFVISSLKI